MTQSRALLPPAFPGLILAGTDTGVGKTTVGRALLRLAARRHFRLLPFKPGAGANLGLAMALNEDDGPGRDGFMAWFGDIQAKEVSPVADLILGN